MKVAIVAPTSLLNEYCITDTQYCLAGLVATNKEYRDFFKESLKGNQTVVLDCSKLGWKRTPEDFKSTIKAIRLLDPSLIILPSEMYDSSGTRLLLLSYLEHIVFKNSKKKVVPVIEGTSKAEAQKEENRLVQEGFELLAIPSHVSKFYPGKKGTNYLFIENHSSPTELMGRTGILASSLPVRLGLAGRLLSQPLPTPPNLTFKEDKDEYPMITKNNVEEFISFYQGEQGKDNGRTPL